MTSERLLCLEIIFRRATPPTAALLLVGTALAPTMGEPMGVANREEKGLPPGGEEPELESIESAREPLPLLPLWSSAPAASEDAAVTPAETNRCEGVDNSYSLDQKWLVDRTFWEMLNRICAIRKEQLRYMRNDKASTPYY